MRSKKYKEERVERENETDLGDGVRRNNGNNEGEALSGGGV